MKTWKPSLQSKRHTATPRARFACEGFTLLELLVAMSLMVIVGACLYTSMYTAFRARQSAEEAILPLQMAQAAIDMFVEDVRGAVEPNTTLAGAFQGVDDRDGTSRATDRLTFYSSHHQVNGDLSRLTCGVGLIELTLVRAEDSDSYHLVRHVTDNILASEGGEPIQEVLCRHVRSLQLRYFDGSDWDDQWNSEDRINGLPLAMEITLELEPAPSRFGPDAASRSRYDKAYLNAIPRLSQVFTLPCGVSQDVLAAAAEAQAASAAQGQAGGPSS